jgi:hypothetical protein
MISLVWSLQGHNVCEANLASLIDFVNGKNGLFLRSLVASPSLMTLDLWLSNVWAILVLTDS